MEFPLPKIENEIDEGILSKEGVDLRLSLLNLENKRLQLFCHKSIYDVITNDESLIQQIDENKKLIIKDNMLKEDSSNELIVYCYGILSTIDTQSIYIYIVYYIANYNSILFEKNSLPPYVEGLKVDENSLKMLLINNLFNYSYKGENRKIISKLNGVEIMCQYCTNITDENKDKENEVNIKLCNMIWKLGFDSEKNRKAIFDNNGIDYLVKNIINSNCDKLIIQSCSALWTMTSYDGVVKILVKKEIIIKLMQILNRRIREENNHKLFIPICGIIEKLSLISILYIYIL